MATLYISYFGGADKGVAVDPVKTETITTSGATAPGAAIPDGAGIAKLNSDTAHYVVLGTGTPTAAAGAGAVYMGANETLWLRLSSSSRATQKFAAITA